MESSRTYFSGGRVHDRGGRGGANRGLVDKAIRSKDFQVNNKALAIRAINGMQLHENAATLLLDLLDGRNNGLTFITSILQQTDHGSMDIIAIPLIKVFLNPEYNKPLLTSSRNRVLQHIFQSPLFLPELLLFVEAGGASAEDLDALSQFGLLLIGSSLEMVRNGDMKRLAKAMQSKQGPIQNKLFRIVCATEEQHQETARLAHDVRRRYPMEPAAVTERDKVPPGGRHNNDLPNYREISLLPSIEEINCSTPPYLPLSSGANRFIADDEQHYLDSIFRLLRHDAIEPIREALVTCEDGASGGSAGRNFCVYSGCRIEGIDVSANLPPSVVLSFEYPPEWNMSSLTEAEVEEVFKYKSRLSYMSIVCFRMNCVPVSFGAVSVLDKAWFWDGEGGRPKVGISFRNDNDFLRLIEYPGTYSMDSLPPGATLDAVVINTAFFSVVNVLRCLQQMDSVPLREYILRTPRPPVRGREANPSTGPPDYLPKQIRIHKHGEIFTLRDVSAAKFVENAVSCTSLDPSQAMALHHALTSKVALIQGPPGTGKSFIGTALTNIILDSCRSVKILCLCYTNHALDQFLESLLDSGITSIARIGSRSKSQRLKPYYIEQLAYHREVSREARRSHAQLRGLCEDLRSEIEKIDSFLKGNKCDPDTAQWEMIQACLSHENPDLLHEFTVPAEEDGFEYAGKATRQPEHLWRRWLSGQRNLFKSRQSGPWALPPRSRLATARQWFQGFVKQMRHRLVALFRDYTSMYDNLQEQKQEAKRLCLQEVRVIGATTSGATLMKSLIESSGAKVVIVEEAGEVLEAHILTSLTAAVQHLILIGDHKQLRPKVQSYPLQVVSGRGLDLDRSMFERLVIHSDLEPSVLTVQRRMRPEISLLIKGTYPDLLDHDCVSAYPNVAGMSKNVIFLDHSMPEETRTDGGSFKNPYEVDMCVCIAKYLIQNGYNPRQLVILTPYLGQLMSIRGKVRREIHDIQALVSEMDREDAVRSGIIVDDDDDVADRLQGGFVANGSASSGQSLTAALDATEQGMRISTVDNFQGEESDIVIISMVRSNGSGDAGFLKEPERINVLLSRAKHGMIIVGNKTTFLNSKKAGPVLKPLMDLLTGLDCLMDHVPSYCQTHPNDSVQLRCPDDFKMLRPNGGCLLPCNFRLSCGHACPQHCHFLDQAHSRIKCYRPCPRFPISCPERHPCPKLCYEECGSCTVDILNVPLKCGHIKARAKCHNVSDPSRKQDIKCNEEVSRHLVSCGHDIRVPCHVSERPEVDIFCTARCGEALPCSHSCPGICGQCKKKGEHSSCSVKCGRIHFCGHECQSTCHSSCPPCSRKCDKKCFHSACPKPCSTVCATCIEPCAWDCPHFGPCDLPCGAPCRRPPCDRRCSRLLSCGHICPSLCGEICPSQKYCHTCGDSGKEIVDLLGLSPYEEYDVDSDPICVLPCGHFYTVSTLDGIMNLAQYYSTRPGSTGAELTWARPIPLSEADGDPPKACPSCKTIIHGVFRYGRVVQHKELLVMERKFLLYCKQELAANETVKDPLHRATSMKLIYDNIMTGGPSQKLFNIVGGDSQMEVPAPPVAAMLNAATQLGAVLLTGDTSASWIRETLVGVEKELETAIAVAIENKYIKKYVELVLLFVSLILKLNPTMAERKLNNTQNRCLNFLDSVTHHDSNVISIEMTAKAERLRKLLCESIGRDEIVSVLSAMNQSGGYNYGTGWSAHWFECPNGHPYYIGECGGAMEQSNCPECGAVVGGSNHTLTSGNRRVNPAFLQHGR